MSQIPATEVTQADLNLWYQMQQQLGDLKSKEALLRARIAQHFFKAPVEGTNKLPLADGWQLKMTHVINRTVDKAALDALRPELEAANIVIADVIRYKPEVAIGNYRQLTEEQQKLLDNALVIKPGTAQLEISLPKRGQPAKS